MTNVPEQGSTAAVPSRRNLLLGGTAVLFTAALSLATDGSQAKAAISSTASTLPALKGETIMTGFITTKDGTQIYYKDWGPKERAASGLQPRLAADRRCLGRPNVLSVFAWLPLYRP
jgi:hypothetical protein